MRTEIDMKTYRKRNQYEWFHTFPDPTYGFDVDIDVTNVVSLAKEKGISFFETFLYFIMMSVNAVMEMKLREEKGHVYLYDVIHPTFTVMSKEGIYQNAGCEMETDFNRFVTSVRKTIEEAKVLQSNEELDRYQMCKKPNVVYATSIPILSLKGVRHPTPAYNYDSLSVPRVLFDRYRKGEDGRYHCTLNMTVSHTLVDGFPLAHCFQEVQNRIDAIDPSLFL